MKIGDKIKDNYTGEILEIIHIIDKFDGQYYQLNDGSETKATEVEEDVRERATSLKRVKDLVNYMKDQGVQYFEVGDVKVQFAPRVPDFSRVLDNSGDAEENEALLQGTDLGDTDESDLYYSAS